MAEEMKRCPGCREDRPLSDFAPERKGHPGPVQNCFACRDRWRQNMLRRVEERTGFCAECGAALPDPTALVCSRSCAGKHSGRKASPRPGSTRKRDEAGNYWCSGCEAFHPREAFDVNRRNVSGVQSRCKESLREQRIKWHSELRAVLLTRTARPRRLPGCTLDRDWAVRQWEVQKGRCHYTGIAMTHIGGEGRAWSNVSIDRIDSTQPYTPENCVLCCVGFNLMKTDLTLPAIEALCRAFIARIDGTVPEEAVVPPARPAFAPRALP